MKLKKLAQPAQCTLPDGQGGKCGQIASWRAGRNNCCDMDIRLMSGMNGDNEKFFRPAMDEICERLNLCRSCHVAIYGEATYCMRCAAKRLVLRLAGQEVK